MAGRIAGITIEIGGNTTKLQSALRGVDSSIRNTQRSLKDVDRLLKFDTTNTDLLRQKQTLLGQKFNETKERLKTLNDAMEQMKAADGFDENSEDAQKLQREIIETEQRLKQAEQAMKDFGSVGGQQLIAVGDKVKDFGGRMSEVGENITKYVTGALVGVGAASVAAFNQVDEGMDSVVAKTGATGADLEDMQQRARDLATQIPTDFATAGDAIGQVNTRFKLTGDELSDLSGKFIKFAELNGTDVSSSIDTVQSAMAAFGVSTTDAGAFLDTLNKVAQDTGADVNKISSEMVNAAPTLKELGFNASDAATFLGELSVNGIDSSSVLSGLRKAFVNATSEGKTMDEKLAELQSTMKNADSDTEAYAAALDLFGNRAGPALASALQEGRVSLERLGTSLQDNLGNVDTTFENTLDPIDEWKIAMNQLKDAGADLGYALTDVVTPMIKKFGDWIKDLGNKFKALNPDQQETIVKIGLMAAAIGPALLAFGKLTSGLGSLIGVFGKVGNGIANLTSGLGAFSTGGVIGLAIAGTTALIGAAYGLKKAQEAAIEAEYGFTDAQKENHDALLNSVDAYQQAQEQREQANASVTAEYDQIRALKDEYNSLVDSNGAISESNQERANVIKGELADALGIELGQIDELIEGNGKLGASIDDVIAKQEAQAYLDANYDSYVEAIKLQTEASEGLANELLTLADAEQAAKETKENLAQVSESYNNSLHGARGATKAQYDEAVKANDVANQKLEESKKAIQDYTTANMDATNQITQYEALKSAATTGSVAEMQSALQSYQTDLQTTTTATEDELKAQYDLVNEQYAAIRQAYQDGDKGITDDQMAWWEDRRTKAKEQWQQAAEEAREGGQKAGSATAEGMNSTKGEVSTAAKGVANAETKPISSASRTVSSAGTKVRNSLRSAFDTAASNTSTAFGKISGSVTSNMDTASQTTVRKAGEIKKQFPIDIGQTFTMKLPTVSVKREQKEGIIGIPKFDISWHKAAYDNPLLFTSPTVLPTANGYHGFGDGNGAELVYGKNNLLRDISQAVANANTGNVFNITVDGAENPEEFADRMVRQLNLRTRMVG